MTLNGQLSVGLVRMIYELNVRIIFKYVPE